MSKGAAKKQSGESRKYHEVRMFGGIWVCDSFASRKWDLTMNVGGAVTKARCVRAFANAWRL